MMKRIHLIGIGGSGMSSIARVLLEQGFSVSGSDRTLSPLALTLRAAGAIVYEGHDPQHIEGVDMVVRSSAIADDNPEVAAALALGIPVLKRQDFMRDLTRERLCIAVAGSHGKTTTSTMMAWSLVQLGLDPGYILGGVSRNLANNAHAGSGELFVVEADEYDYMFLGLNPAVILLTNVEYDHPDCFPTAEKYQSAFSQFVHQLEPGGLLVTNADDPGAAAKRHDIPESARVVTYGLNESADYSAIDWRVNAAGGYDFKIRALQIHAPVAQVSLAVPGMHNVRNALGVLSALHALGFPVQQAADALSFYSGSSRRFEVIGEVAGITIVDDYAHHPSKISATLSAARVRYPHRRLVVVWQPHTYTRTQALESDFIRAFDDADLLVVTAIYAAREQAHAYSAAQLVEKMKAPSVSYIPQIPDVVDFLLKTLQKGDVLIVLSAGDADQICREVRIRLQERKGE
jgi:UDP-N-acetylmuramate--alanine ligase